MTDQEKLEAYAADIEAVNIKHNMQIVPRLEVQYINKPTNSTLEQPEPEKHKIKKGSTLEDPAVIELPS